MRHRKIPQVSSSYRMKPVGFCCFREMCGQMIFSICGTFCRERMGSSEGSIPADFGFPIGARAPCWHTILLAKSSVLYLWRPPGAERGCCLPEHTLSVPGRTGGFCVSQRLRMQGFAIAEAACSCVGGFKKSAAARMFFEITGGAKGI